jgi:hypothetical protein
MADGFKVADAYVEIHGDKTSLREDIRSLPNTVGGDAETAGRKIGQRTAKGVDKTLGDGVNKSATKSGRDGGDKLSQGMQLALVRNSPLIAAAVGGALAAGAPAAIAGAGLLFGGIGIVAAAQSENVKKAWSSTWDSIKTGTEADASVLQGTLISMAQKVTAGFSTLRPALRLMFADAAPLLDDFTDSLVNTAQNAMPGLVNAVHNAGPVFAGLGSLVESTGTGLSGFFDAISQHSDAAGTAFQAIGQIIQEILPVLGDLLGEGAELASVVLPPLADALGIVADALHLIAPILPAVAIGFGAFKIVQTLSGPLNSLAGNLTRFAQEAAFASYQGGTFGKAAGVMSEGASSAASGVSKVANALPVLGVVLGLAGAIFDRQTEQANQWAQALIDGGQAADTAKSQMGNFNTAMQTTNSGFTGVITGLLGFGTQAAVTANSLGEVDDKQKAILASMTPLQRASQDVTTAQNDLNFAVDKYGPSSSQAQAAAGTLTAAQNALAAQEAQTQYAIDGVTQAMLDQANQALAAASSSFAYDSATQQVADAQARLAELQASGTASTSDLNNATNSLNQALLSQAEAAGRLASDSLPATASETDKAKAADTAMLQELYKLRDTMGSQFPAALQTAIVGLENSGVATARAGGQAVTATGQTSGLIQQMIALGQLHPTPAILINNQASAILDEIKSQINNIQGKTVTITTVYRQSGITAGAGMTTVRGQWMGGPVDNAVKAATGRLVGPGTGTSDSIPAIGPGGRPWALSDGEWIIRERIARQQGDARMAALNAGRAQITPTNPATGTGATNSGNTYHVTVQLQGMFDFTKPDTMRTFGIELRRVLQRLDKEVN